MGQLTLGLSHLTVLALISVLMNTFLVNAQDCDFLIEGEGIDKTGTEWKITGEPISEELGTQTIIWNAPSENVVSSTAATHPHNKYLTGHRYNSRYEYRASASFSDFVSVERRTSIERSVTFGCADGKDRKVNFTFPLIDVNDAPFFISIPDKAINVNLEEIENDPDKIINENVAINAADIDFNPINSELTFASDRPSLLRLAWEEVPSSLGIGQEFGAILRLNSTDVLVGRYSVNLFCTDGQYTASTNLTINIL
ncbi:unnamed protein product [Orchesella dallaii]|uniref:Uncharacterized protein n=1 Tax=Orchesella dallaii TaxID=48710 RepID=A0ABP1QSF4_9HEXA